MIEDFDITAIVKLYEDTAALMNHLIKLMKDINYGIKGIGTLRIDEDKKNKILKNLKIKYKIKKDEDVVKGIHIKINKKPPSLNKYLHQIIVSRYGANEGLRQWWRIIMELIFSNEDKKSLKIKNPLVIVKMPKSGDYDLDNFTTKHIIDALVAVGIIEDDNSNNIEAIIGISENIENDEEFYIEIIIFESNIFLQKLKTLINNIEKEIKDTQEKEILGEEMMNKEIEIVEVLKKDDHTVQEVDKFFS
ncbi:MAG: hypothetical protein ACPLVF_02110 [Thermovenabulum sp.]|uniref:hypothetical protein n=1 Tax=Thermovenabulum sp. TaxID=3100335 RepID=UPI003C7E0D9B